METTIKIRNRELDFVGELDSYRRCRMVPRFNDVGTWSLEVDDRDTAAALLEADGGIAVIRDGDPLPFFSGIVDKIWRRKSESEDVLIVEGYNDNIHLRDRIVYPDPALPPPWVDDAYDLRNGVAEDVVTEYVDFNAGPSALADRQVAGLTVAASQGRGAAIKGRGRFQNLMELVASYLLAGGDFGAQVLQVGNDLEFSVYDPIDRTGSVVFSIELDSLAGYTYENEAPRGNYVLVAGGGEGVARVFRERTDAASIATWRRRELFKDQRQTTDNDEMDQAGDEELALNADRTALSISPLDTDAVTFMDHYGLGDRVTAVIDGVPIQDVVREVEIVLDPANGDRVTPVIGTPGATNPKVPELFRRQRQADQRLRDLERR